MSQAARLPLACRNCRGPLHWVDGPGWLHGTLPQYAHEDGTCANAKPVCSPPPFTKPDPDCRNRHITGPAPECDCPCHKPRQERTRQ
jgi:hypothetical protein